jgi:hypothetical protein
MFFFTTLLIHQTHIWHAYCFQDGLLSILLNIKYSWNSLLFYKIHLTLQHIVHVFLMAVSLLLTQLLFNNNAIKTILTDEGRVIWQQFRVENKATCGRICTLQDNMQFLQTWKCEKIHNKVVFIMHINQQWFYSYTVLILYNSPARKASFTFNITYLLRIWNSGPLIYQLTYSIYNLENVTLSVQTEGPT